MQKIVIGCSSMNDQVSLRQKRLALLLKATSGTIRAEDAAHVLDLDRPKAARLLAGWHKQGVIRRVAHGVYVPVQPTALGKNQVLDDPWILVPELYDPGYIGGWSALEHLELTEQLFRSVCVLTSKRTTTPDPHATRKYAARIPSARRRNPTGAQTPPPRRGQRRAKTVGCRASQVGGGVFQGAL